MDTHVEEIEALARPRARLVEAADTVPSDTCDARIRLEHLGHCRRLEGVHVEGRLQHKHATAAANRLQLLDYGLRERRVGLGPHLGAAVQRNRWRSAAEQQRASQNLGERRLGHGRLGFG
eukprot:scaffold123492_cov63-Phaeocystis_antarctica.AAC.1